MLFNENNLAGLYNARLESCGRCMNSTYIESIMDKGPGSSIGPKYRHRIGIVTPIWPILNTGKRRTIDTETLHVKLKSP